LAYSVNRADMLDLLRSAPPLTLFKNICPAL
jgi:hypothetical protein